MLRASLVVALALLLSGLAFPAPSLAQASVTTDVPATAVPAGPLIRPGGETPQQPVVAARTALLLEAGEAGTTGAIPFSGTVTWTLSRDELSNATVIANARIPARGLDFSFVLRLNSDESLPASHIIELGFQVGDGFIGGSVASIPGILLKDEELVPGTPLIGASARVVSNQFLFALSQTPADVTANINLLATRGFIDIAMIYGSGKRAILTLERDDTVIADFARARAAWDGKGPVTPRLGPAAMLGMVLSRDAADAQSAAMTKRFASPLGGRSITLLPGGSDGSEDVYFLVVATASLQEAVSLCADIEAAGGTCNPQSNLVPIALPD